jgi:hypothetical protein
VRHRACRPRVSDEEAQYGADTDQRQCSNRRVSEGKPHVRQAGQDDDHAHPREPIEAVDDVHCIGHDRDDEHGDRGAPQPKETTQSRPGIAIRVITTSISQTANATDARSWAEMKFPWAGGAVIVRKAPMQLRRAHHPKRQNKGGNQRQQQRGYRAGF